jgi:hypothetical protein
MKLNKKLLFLFAILLTTSFIGKSEELPESLISGFNSGDASVISQYFGTTIEMSIDAKENVYSGTQAQLILRDFFKKNPPSSFTIIHKGGQGESKYAIGKLSTSNGTYRITILIKSAESKPYIHQLRIEKDGI